MMRVFTSRQTSRFATPSLVAALMAAGLSISTLALAGGDNDKENGDTVDTSAAGEYLVEDGKVDPDTYDGYIAYTRSCQACHGPDGLGSSFAPNLVRASERRDFAEFARTIAGGREVQPGQVMPAFADDPYVLGNLENIYSYMRGRAAGDIGRGRPQIIERLEEQVSDETLEAEEEREDEES
ncbi:Cytochrome C oxidase, cbb3-type, subunit III [Franzmannia pantelleriensis]|uniref:Cytochrome C oxidase, cbb3-type, subunit III n=1 Tax=Franzmannia pantelleriensis TaxID=48727 RepID=A0A1G9RRJ1_9GAMM|nr:cytochrome c [Halomonas pantelleriensis]SDM25710.1 Cytochrome C oxidase, cbb3-type, subunit III [Halomonas pantelleriensis]